MAVVYGQVVLDESGDVVDLGIGLAECSGVDFSGWIGCIPLSVTFGPELVGGFNQPN